MFNKLTHAAISVDIIQRQAAKGLRWFIAVNSAIIIALALRATDAASNTLIIATIAISVFSFLITQFNNKSLVQNTLAVALMGQVMLMVAVMKGHSYQVDVHMYFFACLGILAIFLSYQVILFATLAVAVHHLALNLIVPAYVFPGDAGILRVLLHATILLIEAGVLMGLCWLVNLAFNNADTAQKAAEETFVKFKQATNEQDRQKTEAAAEKKKAGEQVASNFEKTVLGVVESVGKEINKVSDSAQSFSSTSATTSTRVSVISNSAVEASANVQAVASATEELSSSIDEIARQVSDANAIASEAVREAHTTNEQMIALANSADQIGNVVSMINAIAGQTNLLALNATIEAARAGDAGKGFAVVASEVKSLAKQTAQATEDVSRQISTIQAATENAVESISRISITIDKISRIQSDISAAVGEQGAATTEISRNIQSAASRTLQVSNNIQDIAETSEKTGQSAADLLNTATDLSAQSRQLKDEVRHFLETLRKN